MIEIDFPEKLSRFQFPTNEAACNDKRGEKRNSDSSSISQASITRIEKKRKKRKKKWIYRVKVFRRQTNNKIYKLSDLCVYKLKKENKKINPVVLVWKKKINK